MTIQAVILSGGSGTRLWPASREHYPKQLLPLVSQHSLLQETALRLHDFKAQLVNPKMLVITNEDYRFIIAEQLRQIKQSAQIVLEPVGRNTAPALTLASLAARKDGADPCLLVMPADHVIANTAAFHTALTEGVKHAEQGAMITFGIVPDRAETGYGYLRTGAVKEQARELLEFVEKPDIATAQQYVASGAYLWNSGLFMFKASSWLSAMARLQPEMLRCCEAAMQSAKNDIDFIRVDAQAFAACPSDSIDYAIMEKLAEHPDLGQGIVVPLDAQWSDVGAWDALWAVSNKDANGNAVRGEVMLEECTNTLVHADSRLVAALGCDDMVIVETADALMVAHKNKTQDVKKIVARLKAEGRSLAQTHRKVYRPWGWYDSIDMGERFQVKRIVVNPGGRLSLQMHHHRAEHWIVVRGTARVTCGEQIILLSENESTFIPLGTQHRLENPGKMPLEIIEVQSGSYLGEDDIVRFEDTYGRVKP